LQRLGRKQRCAPGAAPHVPLLAEALNTIAWHCRYISLLFSVLCGEESGRDTLHAMVLHHNSIHND
jgi:hypothetical protein